MYEILLCLIAIVPIVIIWRWYSPEKQYKKVAVVKEIFIYPLKSGRGKSSESVRCYHHGLSMKNSSVRDRCFMTTQPSGQMVSARQCPKLVLVEFRLIGNEVHFTAPGMKELRFIIPKASENPHKIITCRIWSMNVSGICCGDKASEWFSSYIGEHVRLIYHDLSLNFKSNDKLCKFKNLNVYSEKPMISEFHDVCAVNIISESSVEDLNSKLPSGQENVEIRNFRPNIVLSGSSAYSEDNWKQIKIGTVELKLAKLCSRCTLTTVNPKTGEKDPNQEPLTTLRKYRKMSSPDEKKLYKSDPVLSSDWVVIKEGEFDVGSDVYMLR